MPLPPDRDERPRKKKLVPRVGGARSFFAVILLVAGVLFLLSGFNMNTTAYVAGQADRVHNVGLMNDRLVRVLIGVALVLFSGLMKVVAVLETIAHPRRPPEGSEGRASP